MELAHGGGNAPLFMPYYKSTKEKGMAQQEIKGSLARLLATENLIVQHDSTATTASFNTETRVLTLPNLQIDNEHVYDMFVGHEVGHALWTPVDWRDQIDDNVPFDFVNVVEDVRIEKAIQNKFPGLRRDFSHGYTDLNNRDFFAIADKDLSQLSFIDRINLHFKLGDRALIPFSEEEMTYVTAVEEADTFDKVCLVSKMLTDYVNAKRKAEEQPNQSLESESGGKEEGDSQPQQSNSQTETVEEEQEDVTPDSQQAEKREQPNEEESETQRALDDNLRRSMQTTTHNRTEYVTAPDDELSIFPLEFLREDFAQTQPNVEVSPFVIDQYNRFINSIKRDVTFMVQQFEMKKSADAYSRTQVHKTGVLDMEKLHQYKLTDDVFLRQSVTPEGKNHGLVMTVDWSGSMSDHLVATVKQLLVLVSFCRKAGIPYDVYTFTHTSHNEVDYEDMSLESKVCGRNVNVVHVLTSNCSRQQSDKDMWHLFSQAWKLCHQFAPVPYSGALMMGGTPLNNLLMYMPKIINKFQRERNVQKVSYVCLTDGESSPLQYWKAYTNQYVSNPTPTVVPNSIYGGDSVFLRDGIRTYQLDGMRMTQSIVRYLRDKMPDVSITNIYLAGPKACASYVREQLGWLATPQTFAKTGAETLTTSDGWPLVCIVNPKGFQDSSEELECEQGAGKAEVRKALRKFLKNKSASKVLLSSLVDQFA